MTGVSIQKELTLMVSATCGHCGRRITMTRVLEGAQLHDVRDVREDLDIVVKGLLARIKERGWKDKCGRCLDPEEPRASADPKPHDDCG